MRNPILIVGASGTGKTSILDRLQVGAWGKVLTVDSACFTKPKTNLTRLFADAAANQPALILIEDIDERIPSVDAYEFSYSLADQVKQTSQYEIRIVATARKLFDVPERLRAVFPHKIYLNLPTANDRVELLRAFINSSNGYDCDSNTMERLGGRTHAFTGRDLRDLWTEAKGLAQLRLDDPVTSIETLSPSVLRHSAGIESQQADSQINMTWEDFNNALKEVHASSMSEIYIDIPQISWSDIAGSEVLKRELELTIAMTTRVCTCVLCVDPVAHLLAETQNIRKLRRQAYSWSVDVWATGMQQDSSRACSCCGITLQFPLNQRP
jgi:SpoVK/Ycf46/Vps4 family AAA+-type ATPase